MSSYNLAQVNIAKLLAPMDDPILKDFVDNLDDISLDFSKFKSVYHF